MEMNITIRKQEGGPAPVFHVDIHGKMDRKDNLDLDIGMGPMEHCWAEVCCSVLQCVAVLQSVAVWCSVVP